MSAIAARRNLRPAAFGWLTHTGLAALAPALTAYALGASACILAARRLAPEAVHDGNMAGHQALGALVCLLALAVITRYEVAHGRPFLNHLAWLGGAYGAGRGAVLLGNPEAGVLLPEAIGGAVLLVVAIAAYQFGVRLGRVTGDTARTPFGRVESAFSLREVSHLPTLMHAIAHQIVVTSGIQRAVIFTRSSDGTALVLRGAAARATSVRDGSAVASPVTRRRTPLSDLPGLRPLLDRGGWVDANNHPAGPAGFGALARALGIDDTAAHLAIAPLRVKGGVVGLVCINHGAAGSRATHEWQRHTVGDTLRAHEAAIERGLRLRALGMASSEWWPFLRDLPDGFLMVNEATRVIAINTAAANALGQPASWVNGRRMCDGDAACPCPLHTAIRRREPVHCTCDQILPAVPPIPAIIRPVTGPDSSVMLVMVAVGDRAGDAGALNDRPLFGEITALVSHELRTPLATLVAASELALQDDIAPEERQQLLARISRQSVRLEQLVEELADVFRIERGHAVLRPHPTDLHDLCRDVVADLRGYGFAHQVDIIVDDCLPVIDVEAPKIRAVLRNLVSNAIKYSPTGSPVTVRLATAKDTVRVSVTDRGEGIDRASLPHIFDQFYRVRYDATAPKGYGLGLYIARKLVQLHGGDIWADSRIGSGSVFTFTLPIQPAGHGDAALPASKPPNAWRRRL
ncbi:MAG: HAMP domain-containing sensor histidine kinase [Dehalococcoidia bacterium]